MKEKVEQIIRSQSIPMNQEGYESATNQLSTYEYLHPCDFAKIHKEMDWLSQDGYTGK